MTSEKNGAAPSGEITDFAVETLFGDVRDAVLTEFRLMPKPWAQMNEEEQERVIHRAADIGERLVRRAVDLVAARGLPSLPITVGKFTVDGAEIKGTFSCYASDESVLGIRHLSGSRAMFVLASPADYLNERASAEPDNVGALAMPKNAGDRGDEDALAKVGRGKKRGNGGVDHPPPVSELPPIDTSDRPFGLPPEQPAMPG